MKTYQLKLSTTSPVYANYCGQRNKISITNSLTPKIQKYVTKAFGKYIFIGSVAILISSFALQLYISNSYAVKGAEMTSLIAKQKALSRDISELRLAVSTASSLTEVEEKAQKMGFIEMHNAVSVISATSAIASVTMQ